MSYEEINPLSPDELGRRDRKHLRRGCGVVLLLAVGFWFLAYVLLNSLTE